MIEEFLKSGSCTIVDVRTPTEFMGGNVVNSINIPLQELELRFEELSSLHQPLILCCASGGRSGMAMQYLRSKGIDCHNAGGWMEVNYLISQLEK
ncbi:MAG: rhodanese-like domain-containing protein [Ignavibacteria bacterium]|jgi:phage shock protein E